MSAKILVTVSIDHNHILVATPRCPRERPYCYSDRTRLARVIKRCHDFLGLQTDDHLPVVLCAAADEEDQHAPKQAEG